MRSGLCLTDCCVVLDFYTTWSFVLSLSMIQVFGLLSNGRINCYHEKQCRFHKRGSLAFMRSCMPTKMIIFIIWKPFSFLIQYLWNNVIQLPSYYWSELTTFQIHKCLRRLHEGNGNVISNAEFMFTLGKISNNKSILEEISRSIDTCIRQSITCNLALCPDILDDIIKRVHLCKSGI